MSRNKIIITSFVLIAFFANMASKAQNIIQIEPIFEYPAAPEELESLTDKSDYLVAHFWDQLDFKKTEPLNQIALNDAFRVYTTPLRFANAKNAIESIDKLVSKVSGNPTLLVQFTKAAEENFYGRNAEIWADDFYLKFLDAASKNKKISEKRRERYKDKAALLRSTAVGETAPTFNFEEPDGKISTYFPMSTPTIIIFGDPEDTDWRLARLKLDTHTPLNQAIDKGKLNIIYIALNPQENLKDTFSNYSSKWKVGKSEDINDKYDIRIVPSIYYIGSDGKIVMKNVPLNMIIEKALETAGV